MNPDEFDKIDEVADDLDEVKASVEELEDDLPAGADHKTLDALKEAVGRASDAANELEDEKE
jgi:predicted  nucleic acid-binding Zn-ribbon protein